MRFGLQGKKKEPFPKRGTRLSGSANFSRRTLHKRATLRKADSVTKPRRLAASAVHRVIVQESRMSHIAGLVATALGRARTRSAQAATVSGTVTSISEKNSANGV